MRNSLFGLDEASSHDEGQALLTTVYDPIELQVILGILDGAEIPFLIKDRGAGGVSRIIMGYSISGTDIFVPESALDEAEALITPVFEADAGEDEGADEDGDEDEDPEDPDL